MAKPTSKNPEFDAFLREVFGVDRRKALEAGLCVDAPIGCGKPATTFRDDLSEREYQISGLCQVCQDALFTVE